jgi:hypothetical protein
MCNLNKAFSFTEKAFLHFRAILRVILGIYSGMWGYSHTNDGFNAQFFASHAFEKL